MPEDFQRQQREFDSQQEQYHDDFQKFYSEYPDYSVYKRLKKILIQSEKRLDDAYTSMKRSIVPYHANEIKWIDDMIKSAKKLEKVQQQVLHLQQEILNKEQQLQIISPEDFRRQQEELDSQKAKSENWVGFLQNGQELLNWRREGQQTIANMMDSWVKQWQTFLPRF